MGPLLPDTRILQHCVYGLLQNVACGTHVNTMDGGRSLCCSQDYCNSMERFQELLANQSSTNTPSTDNATISTSILTGATSGISTLSPTGEFVHFFMSNGMFLL